jgi:predicted GTPase
MGALLPAMGYGDKQCHELEETIKRVPCDLVLVATPIDLARTIKIDKPNLRVSYEAFSKTQPGIKEILVDFTRKYKPALLEVAK